MKKILITGAGSYVGVSVENYLKQWPERYQVDSVDMVDGSWKERCFRGYDVVYHVAGIAHMEKTSTDPAKASLYEKVNTVLAVDTAKKAKAEGVKQFIFMSSASVYGLCPPVGQTIVIDENTPLKPVDNYGTSKWKAELGLQELADDSFKLVILRPPMIYGRGCKGNYQTLAKIARTMPVFPLVKNQRSMLYIENMAEFIRLMVDNEEQGVFCPQNDVFTNTSEMVNLIAHANGKHLLMVKGLTWVLNMVRPFSNIADRAFGSLCYDPEMSRYKENYCVKNLYDSIMETEGKTL